MEASHQLGDTVTGDTMTAGSAGGSKAVGLARRAAWAGVGDRRGDGRRKDEESSYDLSSLTTRPSMGSNRPKVKRLASRLRAGARGTA